MEQPEWQYRDVHTLLREMAQLYPNKVYIESPDQGRNITFAQTHVSCNKIANFLQEQGIKPIDKIALIGENSIETLLIYLGVLNYGAVICPINVEESEENVYRLLDMAKPKIVFYGKDFTFKQERYQDGSWIPFADFDIKSGQENELFPQLRDRSPEFKRPIKSRADLAVVVFTSGTTATPKGVLLTEGSLLYGALESVEGLHFTERDVILDYRAYNWASPQQLSIIPSLVVGATLVFPRKFSRSQFPSWLKDYGVTVAVGVPAVINFLLEKEVPLHKKDVPSLRFMTSSSSALLVKDQLEFEKKYGILINQMGGMSEAGWIGISDPEDLNHPERRRIGSIGKRSRYKEVMVVDESGRRCKTGEVGEIVVKGRAVSLGYLGVNDEIIKHPNGEMRTGDLGYIDSDGYIYITGRKKDIIIRGGVNISPMEITTWLIGHPAVQEAATIGVPDKARGEEVVSFIVLKEGYQASEEDIINHCMKKLPYYKLPKRVFFLEQMPRTERGKVAKGGLLKIWEEAPQTILAE
jgi:acyl-coenzyme A synthetase/AMP-(fatty) acid ligase